MNCERRGEIEVELRAFGSQDEAQRIDGGVIGGRSLSGHFPMNQYSGRAKPDIGQKLVLFSRVFADVFLISSFPFYTKLSLPTPSTRPDSML